MKKSLLLRDDLHDIGLVSSINKYCSSPDMIVHKKVDHPHLFFKKNYASDPNQILQTGSVTNLIYTRIKNLDSKIQKGYIRMYSSDCSLFMNPCKWKENALRTHNGSKVVSLGDINPGDIGVGTDPFLFNAQPHKYYCHVGYVTQNKDNEPDIPDSFSTYDDFILWVKTNPQITFRNFNYVRTKASNYEQFNELSNPNKKKKYLGAFLLTLNGGFPIGTKIILNCVAMDIVDATFTVKELNEKTQFSASGIIPAGFEGYVSIAVYLPDSEIFPSGGNMRMEAYVAMAKNSPAKAYAINPVNNPLLAEITKSKLLHVGTCSTYFVR